MPRILINFVIVFAAVLVSLLVYSKLTGKKNPLPPPVQEVQDFGVGQIRARKEALTEGFRVADGVKTAYAEYYSNTGKLPTNNAEIGIQPPETYAGKSIKRIDVSERGIVIAYNDETGVDDGRVLLEPEPVDGNMTWKCWSESYVDIKGMVPMCEYRKPTTRE